MNIRQLTYFQAVAEEGGFSAASRRLNIAQPALSGHVAALEATLGVKLLERSNRGVSLTSAGRRMSEHAKNILRQIENAALDVSGGGFDPSGEVMVALPFAAAHLIAGRLVRLVSERMPKVTIRLFEGLSQESGNVMASGRVDLGVIPNAAEIDNLDAEAIFFENLYLVGRWDGKSPREGEVVFAELANYPLGIGSASWNLRRVIEKTALDQGVTLDVKYEFSGVQCLLSVVSEGLCYAISNWSLLQKFWGDQTLSAHRIVNPNLQRTIAIAWPEQRPMTDAVDGVRKILTEILRDAVRNGEWRGELVA